MEAANILVSINEVKKIAIVTLNRPKELNALSYDFLNELNVALHTLDKNDLVNCMILTGSARAFAAGAGYKSLGRPRSHWYLENGYVWPLAKS